jgi:hypothetical protein
MPRWLDEWVRADPPHPGHPVSHWRELARRGVRQGERNATIASFAGHLLWHGVDRNVVRELLLAWNRFRCDPALSDGEVTQAVNSIVHLHERDEEALPESNGAASGGWQTGRVAT